MYSVKHHTVRYGEAAVRTLYYGRSFIAAMLVSIVARVLFFQPVDALYITKHASC